MTQVDETLAADFTRCRAAAIEVRGRAYAPYSSFLVGAALLTEKRTIYSACNVENASFGLTVCAERAAVCAAVAAGERELRMLAVAAHPLATPCGACRQFLSEFNQDLLIVCVDAMTGAERAWKLSELLPEQFDLRE
jgi:cytidine deaminase